MAARRARPPYDGGREVAVLARKPHQLSTAAGDAPHSAVLSRLGVLDVLSSTPPRPSGRNPHCARHLATLATKPGEIPGLRRRSTLVGAGLAMSVLVVTAASGKIDAGAPPALRLRSAAAVELDRTQDPVLTVLRVAPGAVATLRARRQRRPAQQRRGGVAARGSAGRVDDRGSAACDPRGRPGLRTGGAQPAPSGGAAPPPRTPGALTARRRDRGLPPRLHRGAGARAGIVSAATWASERDGRPPRPADRDARLS